MSSRVLKICLNILLTHLNRFCAPPVGFVLGVGPTGAVDFSRQPPAPVSINGAVLQKWACNHGDYILFV